MKAFLVFLSAMELIKLHCLSSFFFLLAGENLPLMPLSLAYIIALATDRILARKSRRVLSYFLVHAAVFAASFYLVLLFTQGSAAQLRGLFFQAKPADLSFYILPGTLALYWLRGLWIVKQGSEHEFTALRFDEGIVLFMLSLFFVALLKLDNPVPGRLAIPFFVFGILALGISNADQGRRGGLSARSKGAMVAAAAGIFILGALGLALLIPSLLEPARKAAAGLKGASLSLLNIVAAILLWLFSRKGPPRPTGALESSGGAPPLAEEIGRQDMPVLLMWILVALLILVAAAILVLLVSMLIKFLSAKTKQSPAKPKGRSPLALLRAFWRSLRGFFEKLVRRLGRRRGLSPALEAYRRVLAAGRAGGAPRTRSETPREYALRLEASFGAAKNQALPIVAEVEKEVYGPGAASHPGDDPAAEREFSKLRQLSAGFSPAKFFIARIGKNLSLLNPKSRRNRPSF